MLRVSGRQPWRGGCHMMLMTMMVRPTKSEAERGWGPGMAHEVSSSTTRRRRVMSTPVM
jgi:hypothetical protein